MGTEYKVYNEHHQIVGYVQGEDSALDKAADRAARLAEKMSEELKYAESKRFFAEQLEADRKSHDPKAKERLALRSELLQMKEELRVFYTKEKQYLSSRRCYLYIGVLAAAALLCVWSRLVALIFGIICIVILRKKGEEIVENMFTKTHDGKKMKELSKRWEEVYTDLEHLFGFMVYMNYDVGCYLYEEIDSDEDDEV